MLYLSSVLLAVASTALGAPTTGTFNILTLNVAGLPAILNDNDVPGDKTVNTGLIGQYFSIYNYSLIHVQEDFNYHAALYAADDHPYRTATSGGVPLGSGLNTLSNFDWVDMERTKWDTCSASGGDCLTPKGFTFMRVKVSEGVWVDAYNIHTDAGTEASDLTARASNLQQVSTHIKAYSQSNPVLVFGDSNSRYTRTGDIPKVFTTDNGMTDAWISLALGGNYPTAEVLCKNPSDTTACEIVDKVWYRGSPAVTLTATQFQYVGNQFLQPNGSVLSDHDPVLVDFTWTLGAKLRLSDPFGGAFGTFYNDLDTLSTIATPVVSTITLSGGNRLDSVSVTLASGQTLTHGGTGGNAVSLTLATGETLTSATICQGTYNDQARLFSISVTTSKARTLSTGVTTSDCVTRTAESGWAIVGFVGRSGDGIDRLGFVYAKI
ncbi:mannose-binding lectin [Pleomassaria siparia CBS 279.74]|uniref:Mannose-binding lectin n=1 Tax=Pleomassaria siparia CBS 279.74 TaxID=1314801 RepID=A0A6G1K6D3_9PLEO|nr:mannose-binding lectin [Pleomassaria siparia CBS 279.74]